MKPCKTSQMNLILNNIRLCNECVQLVKGVMKRDKSVYSGVYTNKDIKYIKYRKRMLRKKVE